MKLKNFNADKYLRNKEGIKLYLNEALKEDDEALLSSAIDDVYQTDLVRHTTPADGNIFLDLGFEKEEAERLKRISQKRIEKILNSTR